MIFIIGLGIFVGGMVTSVAMLKGFEHWQQQRDIRRRSTFIYNEILERNSLDNEEKKNEENSENSEKN